MHNNSIMIVQNNRSKIPFFSSITTVITEDIFATKTNLSDIIILINSYM